jgi:sarcosine oxidase
MRVVVVGAGVVGLAATHALAAAGHDVHCFEAAEPMAARSTGGTRIFRLVHAVPALVRLASDARAGWARWSDAAGEPLVGTQGTVVSGDIEGFRAAMTAVGATHSVHDQIPGLPTTAAPGPFLIDPAGGVIQAQRTGQVLSSAVGRHLVRAAVTHLDIDGSRARLTTADGDLTADAVVLVAGAGTPALAAQVGIEVPATLIHHARFSYPLRDPGSEPPCWIDRSQSWRPGFGTYAHLAAPGRWAVGGHFPDADVAWERGREAVAAMSRDVVTRYVAECVSNVIPEPDEVVYCDAIQGLGDGIAVARTGPVLTGWGDNLFKFAPLLGEVLARAAVAGGLPPELDGAL